MEVESENFGQALKSILEEVVRDIQAIDFTYLMDEFFATLQEEHKYYFDYFVSPRGQAWAPLSQVTIDAKGHDTILRETNALFLSMTTETGDSIRDIGGGVGDLLVYGVFGTSVEYAHYHMTGTSRMPARPFAGIPAILVDEIALDVADLIVSNLKR